MVEASGLERTGKTPCPRVGIVQLRATYRTDARIAAKLPLDVAHAARNEYLSIGQESRRVTVARSIKLASAAPDPGTTALGWRRRCLRR